MPVHLCAKCNRTAPGHRLGTTIVHPDYPLALAGNADPLAGQPDMDALSEFLLGNWVDLLERGMIKAPPKGSILQVRNESSSADPGRGNAPDPRTSLAWPWRVRDLRPPSNGCSRSGQLDRASVSPTC